MSPTSIEKFTCFCNGRDNCNGGRALSRLQIDPVELISCECSGAHCKEDTCIGEVCTYVVNHKTKKIEKGCVNASVPLIERRSIGACMMPPITGAMHHTLAKDANDLLNTESCVCGENYCNSEKPKITVPERQKCAMIVEMTVIGTPTSSKNITCTGEFCFKVDIKSKLGHMSEYRTMGCASFTGDDMLAEELNPTGCAQFNSEQLNVLSCFTTKDKSAIARARANMEVKEDKAIRRKPTKTKSRKPPPKMEIEYEEDEEEEEEEEENADEKNAEEKEKPKSSKPANKDKEEKAKEKAKEKEEEKEEEEEEEEEGKEGKGEESDKKEGDDDDDNDDEPSDDSGSNQTFILRKIAVFVLIILCIVVSGAVWKFELHKKLFRSSYDSVAGG
ncbi:unnamed protein product [Heligmosomoides polygyrus]|uniref:Activin_recp domain-containing protein n=1 Tax=Heligmosomoides polygyrus TaxID=6339 RepID=A0A3P7XKF8_HELPZ|nr:unnamed protein product [Heligmosomoides polygyrus]